MAKTLQRFYKKAEAAASEDMTSFEIHLDGRLARTPDRLPLALPGKTLADAIAAEWDAQQENINPLSMPLTRLACQAIDRVPPQREDIIADILSYGETDMLCFRSGGPDGVSETPASTLWTPDIERSASLMERQARLWQPHLDWAAERYGARMEVFQGIVPQTQPADCMEALRKPVEILCNFTLSGLHSLTHSCGSLVLSLAVLEGRIDEAGLWEAAQLDEDFNIEQWGEDSLATERRENLRRDLDAATQYLRFLRSA